LRVIAFEVNHGDAIKPAYGYRIEYDGRVVTVSGDTRYNENVVRYAAGVDLLIHEVAIVRPELISQPHIQRIMAHHTTAYEAGMVFSRTQPKLAAYSHLVFLASLSVPAASLDDLVSETRRAYAGPLAVGEDLMCFEINEAEVVGTRKSAKAFGIEISPALLARADEVIE
jgi:ribonuclease Z